MCGTWDGEGLYGSEEVYLLGAGNRNVNVARSDRWNGGKVLLYTVSSSFHGRNTKVSLHHLGRR
jgi:hypothetical protein